MEAFGHGVIHVLFAPDELEKRGRRAVVREEAQGAAGCEQPRDGGQAALQIVHVLQHVDREDEIERSREAGG